MVWTHSWSGRRLRLFGFQHSPAGPCLSGAAFAHSADFLRQVQRQGHTGQVQPEVTLQPDAHPGLLSLVLIEAPFGTRGTERLQRAFKHQLTDVRMSFAGQLSADGAQLAPTGGIGLRVAHGK